MSGTTCNPDLACNTGASCTLCPTTYNLVAGTCIQCLGGDNCESCESTSPTTCLTCVRGYYLTTDSLCSKCITGCAVCNDATTCLTCSSGYAMSTLDSSSSGKCSACDASCATCYGNIYSCDTCATGYTKSGWACISNNLVKFGIKVDSSLTAITNTLLMAFIQSIADACGRPSSSVSV